MKKLFLATVKTRVTPVQGGDDVERTRTIPVYADDVGEVDDLVRNTFEIDDLVRQTLEKDGMGMTTILSVDVEEPIGTPD